MSPSEVPVTPSGEVLVARTGLKAGALRLPEVLMQSVTLVAPAIAVLFSFGFIVGFAGVNAPLAFLIVLIIAAMLAVSLSLLARAFPSAGGYFTYISRSVHPRAGMFTGWLFFLYSPLVPAPILAYMGTVVESELDTHYGITFPWWLFFILALAVVMFITYRGIEISGKTLIILGCIEIVIVGALALWSAFDPGPGGFNFEPLNPANVGVNGLYLGVVFGIFSITGWEGAAPIAEESENPRRNVPRALLISVVGAGLFLTICTWFLLLGWGTDDVAGIAKASDLPPLVLADKYWGSLFWVVLIALINSTLAVCIASNLVATRMVYAMGRAGALPKWFAQVHPKYKTPFNATHAQLVLIILSAIIGVAWWGKENIWAVDGLMITFALSSIYVLGNLGVILYYWRERRDEWNWFIHGLFPVASSIALGILVYKSLNPWPADPFKWAPIVVGVWAVLGIVLLLVLKATGKEGWLVTAGRAAEDRETMEELAHRPAY